MTKKDPEYYQFFDETRTLMSILSRLQPPFGKSSDKHARSKGYTWLLQYFRYSDVKHRWIPSAESYLREQEACDYIYTTLATFMSDLEPPNALFDDVGEKY